MEDHNDYLNQIKTEFQLSEISGLLDKAKDLSVLVIGDTIIDHYIFVRLKGRAIKDPILSVEFENEEIYAGGILAIANHLSGFVEQVSLLTITGDRETRLDFIHQSIKSNIQLKTFTKKNSPTTVKQRLVDLYRNNKLFKIEYINDQPIDQKLTEEIIKYLDWELPKHDLVVVGDFGHGFINAAIRRKLEEKSKFLAVNAQSNSSNMGFNYFNLYKKLDFISVNEEELRLTLSLRFEETEKLLKTACEVFNLKKFLVTQGKKGCTFINNGEFFKAPILITSVKDTVGAGDALYAISSLLVYLNGNNKLIPFVANCAGGIAANIMGNKESVTKEKLLDFIKDVSENGLGNI